MPRTTTHVRLDVRGGAAWVVLDGESSRNALDHDTVTQLVEACDRVDSDESIGVAVITGAHGAFCSGAARHVLAGLSNTGPDTAYVQLGSLYRGFERVRRLTVPTIARVDGAAVGAGLNLALVADIRLASDRARFISGFAPNGIHPGGGHLHLLGQAAGRQAASALGVFAQSLSAADAYAAGLVWGVHGLDALDDAVHHATEPLARDPELARALKTSLNLTTSSVDSWLAATEVERARQMWSLTRRPSTHFGGATTLEIARDGDRESCRTATDAVAEAPRIAHRNGG
jgi:enoyl-CoA hydratase